jgi:hypothetical protein
MNRPPKLPRAALAAALAVAMLALGAAPPSASAARKPKPTKAATKIAREIVELERTTNILSGEIAGLTARTATLEGAPPAQTVVPNPGTPTPAPPAPAGGDFGGSFPDPELLPKTVGADQLVESSIDGSQVIPGSMLGRSAIQGASLVNGVVGVLEEADFGSAANDRTLVSRNYREGGHFPFELGSPEEQTLSLGADCPARIVTGGWKLSPGFERDEVMASVPAFFGGGSSPERNWTVTVHEENTEVSVRNIFTAEGLCLR